jgi:hypothetical protein
MYLDRSSGDRSPEYGEGTPSVYLRVSAGHVVHMRIRRLQDELRIWQVSVSAIDDSSTWMETYRT